MPGPAVPTFVGWAPPLVVWPAQVLCKVLLELTSCPERQLVFLLKMQAHLCAGLLHPLSSQPGTLSSQSAWPSHPSFRLRVGLATQPT